MWMARDGEAHDLWYKPIAGSFKARARPIIAGGGSNSLKNQSLAYCNKQEVRLLL
jgi:hypothetical protein